VESRKTVTVLFCDATSSTALGERLDPESLRGLMTRYFDVMREVIEFHGGVVEKFIGDAVMAVFGVPSVHEDDALRACRAALEIRDRLATLDAEVQAERGATVEWRMGVNTGEVVAGDGVSGQRIVTGDAVNVAARLEAAAAPGEILLGADTHALVRGAVAVEALEPMSLKGKSEPVAAWRLTGVDEDSARHSHARPMDAPLVGRQRPLRLLEQAFQEAVEERVCHLFTVLGVAGVGKSRIVDEFVATLGDRAHVAAGRCLAYGHGITYWPVVEAIRGGAGIPEEATPELALERLGDVLASEPDADRVVPVIGYLIGAIHAPQAPEEIFWAIRKTFEAMARQRPLVLVFDDVHWGEPTFLDLIDHIADWTRDAPILLVAMARPELLETRPSWGGGKRWVSTIQLEPLSADESAELVGGLLGQAELPVEVRAQIAHAAEGNPLFVEELLGKLIDDGFLVESSDGWAALGDLRQLAIPPTIQALLAARLDGLGSEERAVIERGAVEGKVFHRGAVTELAPETMRPQVRDRLASLMRMELVRPDQASFAGEEAYSFRHLLIRDAAYQALAKQTRSELHERFATWLERVAVDRLTEYEEIIGYHLEQAYRYRAELGPPDAHAVGLATRAGALLAAAARRADARLDVAAVAELLERAIALMPHEDPERHLLVGQLGSRVLEAGHGERAENLLIEAVSDARALNDERGAAWAELGLLIVRSSTQSTEGSAQIVELERLRSLFVDIGDATGVAEAELAAAFALFAMGHCAEASERARRVDEMAITDPRIRLEASRTIGASAVWGPSPTSEGIREIASRREEFRHISPGAGMGIARLLAMQGRFDEARGQLDEAEPTLRDHGDRHLLSQADAVRGDVAFLEGDFETALEKHRKSYDELTSQGDRGFASTYAAECAEAYFAVGNLAEAETFATIAVDTSASDDIASQGGGRAILARVLSARGEHERAEATGREAVAILERTDYLSYYADALVYLGHVLWAVGKTDEALAAAREALALYQRKEATFLADRTSRLIAEWTSAARPSADR
jgi:class 3 adenylate cyclase/tetratricopeptide (TPR) repeat protein